MRISLTARMSDKMSDKMNAMGRRRRESEIKPLTARARVYITIGGVAALALGLILVIRGGEPVFFSFRGATVFGPVILVIGVLLIVVAVVPSKPAGRK